MEQLIILIVLLAGLICISLVLVESILRTRSAWRWRNGYKFNRHMEQNEIISLLESVQYPEKKEVFVNADGKIMFKTQCHQYPVQIYDEIGCTVIGFLVSWIEVSKTKRKKVACDWDNLYSFLKETSETGGCENAIKNYKMRNIMSTIKCIDTAILLIAIIIFAVLSL